MLGSCVPMKAMINEWKKCLWSVVESLIEVIILVLYLLDKPRNVFWNNFILKSPISSLYLHMCTHNNLLYKFLLCHTHWGLSLLLFLIAFSFAVLKMDLISSSVCEIEKHSLVPFCPWHFPSSLREKKCICNNYAWLRRS